MEDVKQFTEGLRRLPWPLILGLGGLALVHPLISVTGMDDTLGEAVTHLGVLAAISVIWIAVVGLSRVERPVLTLTAAAAAYGVIELAMGSVVGIFADDPSAGLNPALLGFALIPVLLTNGIWGAVTGLIALLVQRMRGTR
ncbi:MAG: hypothetical protein HOU81_23410 [Hamadaea sp.]|uniref:hypothetical protein n=1 Tax=Hamadaea sp. TaxID=2024425 RepID=UPI00178D7344|nr:hypothetical protein [Hamadaea sp.]NUR73772.1 hypothetical protein [Hamadaea sp.]NUT18201.1 hypothetical protein [Hamadaea sp.]